jgi:hypothetical protein
MGDHNRMTGIPGDKIAQAADRPVTALENRPMECSPKNEEGSPVVSTPPIQAPPSTAAEKHAK